MATRVGARPVTAPGWTGQPRTDLALIDCDVHQSIKQAEDLFPYLARAYRQQATEQGIRFPGSGYFNVAMDAARTDLAENCDRAKFDGRQLGDDYELLREAHLDLWHVDHALLTGSSVYGAGVLPDPDFAAAVCRAFNDWTLEHWAARDPRFLIALAVATGDPRLAAQEIDRLGDHPQVKAIMLPTGARLPYGNRHYHPIYEACARHGLVVGIHPGNEGAGMAGPPTGVGYPTYYIETRMARPQMAMAHAVSFIAEGVFEKYPTLKVLIDECDQFWAVGLMWHMDADWKSLRDQTPWVRRLPSEYFREHIRVGSQPMLEPEDDGQFFDMLDALHADETLVYSSDWPHWDWDDPATTFPKLPERLHRRVFSETARELFGL
ncbi:MAG TPA: amidohydrolase family protein [Thermomicrobiales bacterium]|nr:amidohydrolase family protein [Thermomicrobiales bacterium]